MKKEPLFPKKEKMDVDHQIMEAGVRLRGLQRKYRVVIERELRALRHSRTQKRDNPKAVTNLKNAYYSLAVTSRAQERLREVTSLQELCKAMNEMGAVLKLMNRIDGRTEKVKVNKLNAGIRKLDKATQRDDGGMQNIFQTPLDSLVEDEIIERLLKGESVDACLDMEDGILMDMEDILPFGETFAGEPGEEVDLDQSMADIDELMRNL